MFYFVAGYLLLIFIAISFGGPVFCAPWSYPCTPSYSSDSNSNPDEVADELDQLGLHLNGLIVMMEKMIRYVSFSNGCC